MIEYNEILDISCDTRGELYIQRRKRLWKQKAEKTKIFLT